MSSQRDQNQHDQKTDSSMEIPIRRGKVDTPNGSLQIQQMTPLLKMIIPNMKRKASFYFIETSI